jgi:hypothetical protein
MLSWDEPMEKWSCLITQVYVLDEEKQLVMVMGSKPTTVEKNMENITKWVKSYFTKA